MFKNKKSFFALFAYMDVGKGREQDAEASRPLRLKCFSHFNVNIIQIQRG